MKQRQTISVNCISKTTDFVSTCLFSHSSSSCFQQTHQQEIFSTSNATLIFIAASSFTRYRVTYGIGTKRHVVLVLHTWHTTTSHSLPLFFSLFGTRELSVAASCCVIGFAVAERMLPHLSQITAKWRSDEFSSRSCSKKDAPWAMIESRSISPKRIPP